MTIQGTNNMPALRLVGDTSQLHRTARPQPTAPPPTNRNSDQLQLQGVYNIQPTRVSPQEALRRLDQVRSKLVAARTQVPIHFDSAAPRLSPTTNPYANPYTQSLRMPVNAAAQNAAAVEQATR